MNRYIIYILFVIIILIIYYFYNNKTNEIIHDTEIKTAVIPFNVFQTWKTKNLPPKMNDCVTKLQIQNPEFNFYLFDDEDCRAFIKENFSEDVLFSYDKLIPGAYKADLWRYCVLYKRGGIYLDIKFQCENGFKLSELTDKEYFVLDRPYTAYIPLQNELALINDPNYYKNIYHKIDTNIWERKKVGIYNAVMACKAGNPILMECINEIVNNVKNNLYCYNSLYVTGPGLLGNKYFKHDYTKIKDFELFNSLNGNCIISKRGIVMSQYPDYRREQKNSNSPHYFDLWKQRNIYNHVIQR